jgi:hypothetical protein
MSQTEENMSQLALTNNSEEFSANGSRSQSQSQEPYEENAEATNDICQEKESNGTKIRSTTKLHKIIEKDFDVVKEARCNYCKAIIKCESRVNGTSSLCKHMKIWKKNPNKINDTKQPVLQATASEDGSKPGITAWRFDPKM